MCVYICVCIPAAFSIKRNRPKKGKPPAQVLRGWKDGRAMSELSDPHHTPSNKDQPQVKQHPPSSQC